MAKWIVRRWRHWKSVLWGPPLKVSGTIFTLVSVLSLIRAETTWIPKPYRDLPIVKWLPSWPWTTWAIIGLGLLLVTTLEGSFRLIDGSVDSEEVLAQLARLRAHGIKLLNADPYVSTEVAGAPKGVVGAPRLLEVWFDDQQKWCDSVGAVLREQYPERTRLRFENLGAYEPHGLDRWGTASHRHELENLAERLDVLDDIMEGKYGQPIRGTADE